ncbi:FAD-dependent oxidoreductase [Limnohabitans radicicola]|uniref:FAD-dependent oxidoreductase n=1 Tax=Limnohabitans radicicola TaxID=2771427 RepID=A0A927FJ25_9BURK|nr:FAD-dependent oxidoreductase [Limnohabitans radicicola]MBD8050967.1 FAD-dependent oxidoreductase [Limnohabitans radicicola]
MASTLTVDVLIAGGGPCGLMLAIELGRRNIRCLLVDAKPGTAFNPQANATQARTMEHFRRLGFAHEIRSMGLPPDHATDIAYLTRFAGTELARLRLPTAAAAPKAIKAMSGSWSAAELPHRVSQKYVEVCLHQHAQQQASVEMRYGWQLTSFQDTGDGIDAWVQSVNGEEQLNVQAAYLVGADGARSMVRHQLGIAWGGATGFKRKFMGGKMLAVYLKAPDFYARNPNDRAWMYVVVNPELRAFIMSVDGVSEFAFHIQMADDAATEALTEVDARRLFAQAFGQAIDIDILSMATWMAGHALVAESFQQGRVFLGGDAAHLFTPTGGLGYNTAVEDAVNLGWKLASVLKGQAPAALLDSYQLERHPLAVRNTGYARQFADSIGLFEAAPELEHDSPQGEAARAVASDYLNGHVRREFNIPGVTFGGRYDASPIIVGDGTTAPPDAANSYTPCATPGGRPPHAWLPDGRSLFDTFHTEWTLLVLGPERADTTAFENAAAAMDVDLKVVHQTSGEILALYEAPMVLIRPDQIVAWRGHDVQQAQAVLAQVLGHGVTVRA